MRLLRELLAGPSKAHANTGSFDFAADSLCESTATLRMTVQLTHYLVRYFRLRTPCILVQMIHDTPPELTTSPELADVLAELSRREPIFHRPEFGISRADFERMTADDFWEVGASGRRYSRTFVLDELEKRFATPHEDVWETSDFRCQKLAADVYLLTYTLVQTIEAKKRRTQRSTIWRREGGDWNIVYHQGTVIQD
jgi:hypothetical protein